MIEQLVEKVASKILEAVQREPKMMPLIMQDVNENPEMFLEGIAPLVEQEVTGVIEYFKTQTEQAGMFELLSATFGGHEGLKQSVDEYIINTLKQTYSEDEFTKEQMEEAMEFAEGLREQHEQSQQPNNPMKNMVKEVMYMTTESMNSQELHDAMALCNVIQDIVRTGENTIEIEGQQSELKEIFNEMLGATTMYPYYDDEDRQNFIQYVQQQQDTILNSQSIVTKDDYEKHKQTNKKYLNTFWEDLEMWKKYDLINDIMNNLVMGFHQENYEKIVRDVGLQMCQLAQVQQDNQILISNSIAKEDTTGFIMSVIFIEQDDKEQLVEHYEQEDCANREDRQRYIDRLWERTASM